MHTLPFRLLLIAAFLLNGFGAPWMMTRMADAHSAHTGMQHLAGRASEGRSMHGMPQLHRPLGARSPKVTTAPAFCPGDCCDCAPAGCRCGCALAAAMPVAITALVAQQILVLSARAGDQRLVPTRGATPFRPPTV